jgi:hypothetical protein
MRGSAFPHLSKVGPRQRTPLGRLIAGPREAFIPDGSPYLEQAIPGEPLRHCNVLFRTGDSRDEISICCGYACDT